MAFHVALVLWVTPGLVQLPWFKAYWLGEWMTEHITESIAALIAAILLCTLSTNLSKGEFILLWPGMSRLTGGTFLPCGRGFALGSLMFKIGVGRALGET
jgi:sodium-dependent dicarboxylate transporter 2/3/5